MMGRKKYFMELIGKLSLNYPCYPSLSRALSPVLSSQFWGFPLVPCPLIQIHSQYIKVQGTLKRWQLKKGDPLIDHISRFDSINLKWVFPSHYHYIETRKLFCNLIVYHIYLNIRWGLVSLE